MKLTCKGKSESVIDEVIAFRRDLHEHRELSGEEFETSKKIQLKLEEYGIPYETGYAKTGVLGIIKGGKLGKNHFDPYFILNEDSLPYRVELMAQSAIDILSRLNKEAEVANV